MPPDVELSLLDPDASRTGPCLIELTFTPQTEDEDGDFVQAVLTEGQYQIINP
jgi:hypothetical protein